MSTSTPSPETPSPETPFLLHARVTIHGLVKAPDLNGKSGIVTSSSVKDGRQAVLIPEISKSVSLKLCNMEYEGRSVDSLSLRELKTVVKKKFKISDVEVDGMEKSELRAKVEESTGSTEEIAGILYAEEFAPKRAADNLATMSPEHLRQQAQAMRTMDPNTIRQMNPQMAHFSDAQIKMAANQMEMMANNPDMMNKAVDQMKNMSPEELKKAQEDLATGNASPQQNQAPTDLSTMSPEQLHQQAEMMRSMDPETIRSMNPHMKNMTDDQLKQAADQMDMMADNPELLKMAAEKVKGMPPGYLEKMKKGMAEGELTPESFANMDASKIAESMDPETMKQSIQMLKTNPEMVKQLASQTGMSEKQLNQTVQMFGNMSDDQMDKALRYMTRLQKCKTVVSSVWNGANRLCGGHLVKILIFLVFTVITKIVNRVLLGSGGSGGAVGDVMVEKDDPIPVLNQDEFGDEF